jgi:hypothetical protein
MKANGSMVTGAPPPNVALYTDHSISGWEGEIAEQMKLPNVTNCPLSALVSTIPGDAERLSVSARVIENADR